MPTKKEEVGTRKQPRYDKKQEDKKKEKWRWKKE